MISDIFDILGRIAFPIFIFLLIEGYFRTTNRWKYLGMLLLFGIISKIPYDMFTTASYFEPNGNNIMFTLALVLVIIWIIDTLKEKMGVRWRILWYFISAVIVGAGCLSAMILGLDYEYHAVLIGYFLYIFHKKPVWAIPFCFLAMYEKDGFPAEKLLYFMIRQKMLTPGIRPYKSENLYEQLEEREKIKKEVRYLEEKAKGASRKPQNAGK